MTPYTEIHAVPLSQLNKLIAQVINLQPDLQDVWVTAETSDLRVSGGHCYLELVEKNSDGRQTAKVRATIWSSRYYAIADKFLRETGQHLQSDMKVMVKVTATFHPLYGMSLNISDINTAYTLGDTLRRRNEILEQLKADGIIDDNRMLQWPTVAQRIAVVSAEGAAGFGDFMDQLHQNPYGLWFCTKLFPAVMQGENAAPSIISALDVIASELDSWDCVVIIRGGGASTDLLCFDNFDLAAHIAQFPIPVVVGIGHERDITVLDYVANMRVKTPTAAAEWLIRHGAEALAHLNDIASSMLIAVSDKVSGCHRQLSFIEGRLPAVVTNALTKAKATIDNYNSAIRAASDRRLRPEHVKLHAYSDRLAIAVETALSTARRRLQSIEQLIEALSPEATLKRGYSITHIDGHAITSAHGLKAGQTIVTTLASGVIQSEVLSTK